MSATEEVAVQKIKAAMVRPHTSQGGHYYEPAVFRHSWSGQTIGQMYDDSDPVPAIPRDWIHGPGCVAISFKQYHDGTLSHTLRAVSVLAQAATEHIKAAGGEWECSKVLVKMSDKRHPERGFLQLEEALIVIKQVHSKEKP